MLKAKLRLSSLYGRSQRLLFATDTQAGIATPGPHSLTAMQKALYVTLTRPKGGYGFLRFSLLERLSGVDSKFWKPGFIRHLARIALLQTLLSTTDGALNWGKMRLALSLNSLLTRAMENSLNQRDQTLSINVGYGRDWLPPGLERSY